LAGYYASIPVVLLKWSEHPSENLRWPDHIIIGEHCNCCLNLWDGSSHLPAFIGVCDREKADLGFSSRHTAQHVFSLLSIRFNCNEKELIGTAGKDSFNCSLQFFSATIQCGDDNCHILSSQFWVLGRRYRLEGPEGN
jgi:hypothetical protein